MKRTNGPQTPATGRRAAVLLAVLLTVAVPACRGPAADGTDDEALERVLRQRIEEAYDFSHAESAERMTSLYPATGRVVSASGGRLVTSPDSLRQGIVDFWDNVGRNMQDPRWEWGEVHVDRLAPDAAVLTATWSIPHIAPTGRPHVIGGAWTAVFRRVGGEWLIVHEHLSGG